MAEKKSKVGKKKVVSCRWREKIKSREEMLKYLKTADR